LFGAKHDSGNMFPTAKAQKRKHSCALADNYANGTELKRASDTVYPQIQGRMAPLDAGESEKDRAENSDQLEGILADFYRIEDALEAAA